MLGSTSRSAASERVDGVLLKVVHGQQAEAGERRLAIRRPMYERLGDARWRLLWPKRAAPWSAVVSGERSRQVTT
jgi:hypothetical protein